MKDEASADRSDAERELTRRLADAGAGAMSAEELFPLVHRQLRAMAQKQMAAERPDHTLQATALVHEAYLRVVPDAASPAAARAFAGRVHFFRAAADAMRHILIDHARARLREKRGGRGRRRVDLSIADAFQAASSGSPEDAIALDEALQRLREVDARAAEIVHLRFYAGLSVDEVAEVLGVSPRTVDLDWKLARAFLYRLLSDPSDHPAGTGGAS